MTNQKLQPLGAFCVWTSISSAWRVGSCTVWKHIFTRYRRSEPWWILIIQTSFTSKSKNFRETLRSLYIAPSPQLTTPNFTQFFGTDLQAGFWQVMMFQLDIRDGHLFLIHRKTISFLKRLLPADDDSEFEQVQPVQIFLSQFYFRYLKIFFKN